MTTHSKPAAQSVARRCLTGLVAVTMVLGPVGQPAFGAALGLTKLTDLPIAAKVAAKPNIVYTLDDSGSMNLNYLPDFVPLSFCRSGTGVAACGTGANFNLPPFWAADYNHLTYDPNVTYQAPKKYDGSSYSDQTAALTTNFTKVQPDPFLTPLVFNQNLAANVTVPLYCNSDWPLDTTIGTYGEYQAGKGADCRINGTRYDASATSGAPAVVEDYNYPWSWTVAPPNPKYFWRNGGNKTLWCDTTNANWPQTCTPNGIYSCTVGVPTGGSSQAQTCYFTGNAMGCNPVVASRTYTPAACNATPTYCAPGIGGSGAGSLGTGTVPTECLACNCNNDTVTGRNGACHLTSTGTGGSGAGCSCAGSGCTLPACANFVTAPTGCTLGGTLSQGQNCVACVNGGAACGCNSLIRGQVSGGTSLQDDANLVNGGTGTICRRNNISYAGVGGPAASPVNYTTLPLDVKYKTQINANVAVVAPVTEAGLCTAVPSTVSVPRHYYTVASVQFCNNAIVLANDQWKGFGTGVCQNKNEFTTYKNIKYGQFHRIGLVNDGRTFAFTDPINGPSTRTWAQEMVNYSNWWAYYRTRVLAAKSTSAIAFSYLDQTWRVGFHTLSTPNARWLDVNDWTPGLGQQRDKWYAKLFGVTIAVAQTPTLDALLRIGELFKTGAGGVGSLPVFSGYVAPETGYLPATAADPLDPLTGACQNNFHILFTDGFTNEPATPAPAWIGEKDGGNVPCAVAGPLCLPPDPGATQPDVTVAGLRALSGTPWPNPYKDPIPTANTLADIALFYWMTDLRLTPPLGPWAAAIGDNKVPSDDGRLGADLDWTKDPAFWQHVNFSAISFGSEGILDASNRVAVTNSIASGASKWFTLPNAPTPPNNPTTPAANKGATAVDDLWHATVNARGTFVYAKNPLQVAVGLSSIIAGISNNQKSRAGAAFAGSSLNANNNRIFEATIEKGWAGDLKKVEVNPATGAELVQPPDWSAGTLLNTLLATPAPGASPALDSDNTWFKNRRIVAWKPGTGAVPFLQANLSAAQLATLSIDPVTQQKMIAYLRGGSTFGPGTIANGFTAPLIEGTSIGQFRQRFGKLGDISDSKPLVIGPTADPSTTPPEYYEATDPGITAFSAAHKNRAPRIFVGANDGMVHVFDAGPLNGPGGGDEMFAYIPSALFNTLNDEDGSPKGIQALTYQDGGIPIYKHHFYANAAPRAVDVDFANTGGAGGSGDWHTIVVGGLGKGGNVYYAIDATNPTALTDTEAAVAPKVLWEFTRPDIQFTFGRPVIGKTRADGWVVVVTSGYDNVSGKGQIHFINAKTGAWIRTLTTTAADTGTLANPSGLTQINGFTQDFNNQIIEQIYGGDLNGNVWRFDVSDPNPANWTTVLFAQLTDPSGVAQPVTTAPQIEIDLNNGVDRWVFFGTGRLLHADDLTIPFPEQIETFYAIRDGTITAPDSSLGFLPVIPRATLKAGDALTIAPIAGGAPKGWYIDLPLGQRIVVDPEADLNVAAFVATAVPSDPCTIALPAFIYARDFTTAESDVVDSFGAPLPSFPAPEGAVSIEIVALQDPSSAFPKLSLIFSKETTGATTSVGLKVPSITGGHRMSWRLLGQ